MKVFTFLYYTTDGAVEATTKMFKGKDAETAADHFKAWATLNYPGRTMRYEAWEGEPVISGQFPTADRLP